MDGKITRSAVEVKHALRQQRASLVADRIPPVLIVVDTDLNIIGWSPNSEAAHMLERSHDELLEAVRSCCELGTQVVHVVDEDIVLRIVALQGYSREYAAIMIESFGHRGSLERAAKAYGLTKREVEILSLVVQGMSNAEIAEGLYIAHSTVADHIKSLMRKTRTTKRIHLLSKIAYGGDVAV
jgi:DNA-binding NarL/FixJ family response regulator